MKNSPKKAKGKVGKPSRIHFLSACSPEARKILTEMKWAQGGNS